MDNDWIQFKEINNNMRQISRFFKNMKKKPFLKMNKIKIICPICQKSGIIKIPIKIIKETQNLTTILIPKKILCKHSFQAFVDKNFEVRGYQKINYTINKFNISSKFKPKVVEKPVMINRVKLENNILEIFTKKRPKEFKEGKKKKKEPKYRLAKKEYYATLRSFKETEFYWKSPKELIELLKIDLETGKCPYIHSDKFCQDKLDVLKRKMKKHIKLDPVWIWFEGKKIKGLQGRHRIIASYKLGIEKIPVLFYKNHLKWKRSERAELEKYTQKKVREFKKKYPKVKEIADYIKVKLNNILEISNEKEPPQLIGYHGTSLENAKSILENGFEMSFSDRMFFGLGVYLSRKFSDVLKYKREWERTSKTSKGVILEVKLPSDIEWEYLNQIEGLGTLQQFIKNHRKRFYRNQIKDRFLLNSLDNFAIISLSYDPSDLDSKLIKSEFKEIANKILEKDYIENIKEIREQLDKKEAKKFYKYFNRIGEFFIDNSNFRKYLRKKYYEQAKWYGEKDVGFAPTQIIIYSEKLLNQLEIRKIPEDEYPQYLGKQLKSEAKKE
jgi:hypothetical protein